MFWMSWVMIPKVPSVATKAKARPMPPKWADTLSTPSDEARRLPIIRLINQARGVPTSTLINAQANPS